MHRFGATSPRQGHQQGVISKRRNQGKLRHPRMMPTLTRWEKRGMRFNFSHRHPLKWVGTHLKVSPGVLRFKQIRESHAAVWDFKVGHVCTIYVTPSQTVPWLILGNSTMGIAESWLRGVWLVHLLLFLTSPTTQHEVEKDVFFFFKSVFNLKLQREKKSKYVRIIFLFMLCGLPLPPWTLTVKNRMRSVALRWRSVQSKLNRVIWGMGRGEREKQDLNIKCL